MNGPRKLPIQQGQASGSTVGDMGPRTCYEYGVTGHLRRWCPKLQQQNTQPPQGQFRPVNHSCVQGGQPPRGGDPKKGKTASTSGQGSQSRVYAMAAQDLEPSVLVESMVLCYSTWAHVLFDSGASRSFMSTYFASILDLEIAPLSCPLFVETPMGGVMEAKWGCSGYVLNVGGYEVVIDLVLLHMTVFDVIVGMDWLAPHHAVLDCFSKKVTFQIGCGSRVSFYADRGGGPTRPLIEMENKWLGKNGGQHILFTMPREIKRKVTMDCIPQVCDFADVFPDELPGLPPHKEMDISIDLYPSTDPISLAPFWMALVELKELNLQLQELQGKGFI